MSHYLITKDICDICITHDSIAVSIYCEFDTKVAGPRLVLTTFFLQGKAEVLIACSRLRDRCKGAGKRNENEGGVPIAHSFTSPAEPGTG